MLPLNCLFFEKEEKTVENMNLQELESEIYEFTKKQNYISNCGLSKEVTTLAIKELEKKKEYLKYLMHDKVDEL